MNSLNMSEEFYRIRRLPPYVFAEVNAMKASARADGADIIDFGMGNPDLATPRHVVDKMVEAVQDPKTHRYSNSRGIPGLRRAIAGYYDRRFGVEIDQSERQLSPSGPKRVWRILRKRSPVLAMSFLSPIPLTQFTPLGL